MAGIAAGVDYIKSVPGVMKILEMIFLLISASSVGYFWDNWIYKDFDDYERNKYIKCFIGATGGTAILALLFFLMFTSGIHRKIDLFNWAKMGVVILILLAILVFVASGLLADTVRYYEDNRSCKIWDSADLKSQCIQLTVGTVFGFFGGLVLLADGIVHLKL